VAIVLNLIALALGLGSAILLAVSPDPIVNILARAASPTVVSIGRGPDMNAISELGMAVRAGAVVSRRRVRMGCVGLGLSFVLQATAWFV